MWKSEVKLRKGTEAKQRLENGKKKKRSVAADTVTADTAGVMSFFDVGHQDLKVKKILMDCVYSMYYI